MRGSIYLTVLAVFFLLIPQPGHAASFWDYFFTPSVPDFDPVYLNDAKTPHLATYAMDPWTPEVWTQNRGSQDAVIKDFYINNIIKDQYVDDGLPVLQVGQRFMELSGNDKRRVVEYIDHAFGVTKDSPQNTMIIHHWKKCDTIGVYTQHGLQLQ